LAPFSLVVFDLDGTLIDSIGDLCTAVNRTVAEWGGRRLSVDEVARMVGEGARLLVGRAVTASGAAATDEEALARFLDVYDGLLPGDTRPYPGIPQLLERASSVARLAVLTNKPTDATRKILDACGLSGRFVEIIGGDGRFRRKPHPDGLLHLARSVGVDPGATLMVGDSTVDLLTARAAGAALCVARYGFGQLTFDSTKLDGSERFADAPADILRAIRGARPLAGRWRESG
jgi:phosphoglycolate phosphatase